MKTLQIVILELGLFFLSSCNSFSSEVRGQDQQLKLTPLLLQPNDFDLQINWLGDFTLGEIRIEGETDVTRTVYRLFDGQIGDNILLHFEHDFGCYKEPIPLEPSSP